MWIRHVTGTRIPIVVRNHGNTIIPNFQILEYPLSMALMFRIEIADFLVFTTIG